MTAILMLEKDVLVKMKKIGIRKNDVFKRMRHLFIIAILVLFLFSGLVVADEPVMVKGDNLVYPVIVSASVVEGVIPLEVTFTVEDASTTRARAVEYFWFFGDDTKEGGDAAHHIYTDAGIFAPSVKVRFTDGHDEIVPLPKITALDKVVVIETPIPEQAPSATPIPACSGSSCWNATPAPTPIPGPDGDYFVKIVPNKVEGSFPLQVRFTSETEGGTPLSWQWDFGDGQANNVEKPSHDYGTPGTYIVNLSVQFTGIVAPVWIDAEPVAIMVE